MNSEVIVINPSISEKIGAVFEKKKRTVEWPNRDELLAGCEDMYQKHKGELREKLLDTFFIPEDDISEQIERTYWGTVYMLEKMRVVTPIKLGLPIKIVPDWTDEPSDRLITDAEYKGEMLKSPIKTIVFKISILPIVMDVLEDNKKEDDFYLDYIIDSFDGVEEEMRSEREKHTAERFASCLGSAVHEWSHGLYFVDAYNKKNKKKRGHILENAINRMSLDFGHISRDEYMKKYYNLDPERRARIWERDFLRKNFPESKRLVEIQIELGSLGNQIG